MSLSIGILGLPNVGKSTLFNALTRTQKAESANYPFCTIEPNKAVIPVPDERLQKLAACAKPQKITCATVDFVDIAGLVRGASRGEGLGNKFLANVREADALLHVVRCFEDDNVVHVDGSVDPLRDMEVIETELILADYQTMESRADALARRARADRSLAKLQEHVGMLQEHLAKGLPARSFDRLDNENLSNWLKEAPLLTAKRVIYCANVGEDGLVDDNEYVCAVRSHAEQQGAECVRICARMEEELAGLPSGEAIELLQAYGVEESGLDQIARLGYHTLGLISFLTAGPKEVRAWTIHCGWKAPQAAGVIHTDFERGFIRAQVIRYEDYIRLGSEQACREHGLMRTEGKDYVVQDGDVIEFLFNV